MTRYSFVKQYSSADASCAAACTSAPQTALCLFDTLAPCDMAGLNKPISPAISRG